MLAHVKQYAGHSWIYPLFCFAAHSGARRSEIMRALVTDVDFTGNTVLIREKSGRRRADDPPRSAEQFPEGSAERLARRPPRRPGPVLPRRAGVP